MKDRVVANIFAPRPRGNWNVSVRTGKPERDGRNFKVPLEVSMPSTVALLPKGEDRLVGGFTVYLAVGSPQGALSTVSMSAQPVGMNPAAEAEFRKEPIVWTAMLTVAPGRNVPRSELSIRSATLQDSRGRQLWQSKLERGSANLCL